MVCFFLAGEGVVIKSIEKNYSLKVLPFKFVNYIAHQVTNINDMGDYGETKWV